MQGGQPNAITSTNYGMPMTCVCTPNQPVGLGAYGTGLSAVPTMGQAPGQTMVYNVPGNDLILIIFIRRKRSICIHFLFFF